ncbi:glycosyltransferase [Paenibacillus pasadenensis]|uniref:glycosyltransferase n=1 Tax=Paenibacillus pasadenensis TaxID=217090 RepID=UPI00203B5C6C|nr:glycosyltransferase [Paenibacillus pasadenensis]MCM3747650.1 glycosyltransferase [Paenibacillus pasadenensis]
MISQMISELNQILARNKPKNLFGRSNRGVQVTSVSNIKGKDGESFLVENANEMTTVLLKLEGWFRHFKIVYRFESIDAGAAVSIENSEGQVFNIGQTGTTTVVYYCRFEKKTDNILFHLKNTPFFSLGQLEILSITESEYKLKKAEQYSKKVRLLVKQQPHLKQRFFEELKENGLKEAVRLFKNKAKSSDLSKVNIITTTSEQKLGTKVIKNGILVVSHDAQRAGAAILALNICKTLKYEYKKQVYILLMQGGPNEKEFEKYGTVYNLNQSTLSYLENESSVKLLLEGFVEQGIKHCIANTVVTGILSEGLYRAGIKTVNLVHELPTSIKTYNFSEGAKKTSAYSSHVVFPNQFVKTEFKVLFEIDEEKIVIQPQGAYARNHLSLSKDDARKKICSELKISSDSKLVINCGYADMRKGIDLFFEVAKLLIKDNSLDNIHFLWIGNMEQVLKLWLEHDAKKLGLDKNFHFIGFTDNPQLYFQAADLFLLTSREDPFPTVVLEALDSRTPVIAFKEAGGIPELLEEIGGVSVDYGSTHQMASAARRILFQEDVNLAVLNKGKAIIDEKYNHENYVAKLLSILEQRDIELIRKKRLVTACKVSVVIPNYNYEDFLEERIYSITSQTIQPYEIIFLDDCSKDNSVNKARSLLEVSGIPFKIIENETNNGCFRQWIKGIQEATGDLIWIAEADDVCELNLIESLIPAFDDHEVSLSYSQSQIINEYSERVPFSYTDYTNDLSREKWLSEYVLSGQEEVVQGLAIKNTIPNASAVIMRKSALISIEKELSRFDICGDWLTYLFVIKDGKIAFQPQILNYHRRHSKSIISVQEQSVKLYQELIEVKKFILTTFELPASIQERFIQHIKLEYKRLGCKETDSDNLEENTTLAPAFNDLKEIYNNCLLEHNYLRSRQKILLVSPDFEIGGGQMLIMRLANFFAAFHDVYVCNARPGLQQDQFISMLSSSITITPSFKTADDMAAYIRVEGISIVNSHIWWSDKLSFLAVKENPDVKWVISMHGCYEAIIEQPSIDRDFGKMVEKMFQRADHIIYATDKNKQIFNRVSVPEEKRSKIYYGYKLQNIQLKQRAFLGINDDALIYGLVSRGIKEKGWEESILSIIKLQEEKLNAHLVLVGASEFVDELKLKYSKYPYIHFIPTITEPSGWIGWVKMFDVGLLPSYFVSESLPNTVIEYLAYGKPVISTNIGDIKYMITAPTGDAGLLLELDENRKLDWNVLYEAMRSIYLNSELRERLTRNVPSLFEQFQMETFASNYFSLYTENTRQGVAL